MKELNEKKRMRRQRLQRKKTQKREERNLKRKEKSKQREETEKAMMHGIALYFQLCRFHPSYLIKYYLLFSSLICLILLSCLIYPHDIIVSILSFLFSFLLSLHYLVIYSIFSILCYHLTFSIFTTLSHLSHLLFSSLSFAEYHYAIIN